MARAPDPKYAEALKLYISGKKSVEIAKQLDLPEGTVRRWKSTHDWDSERSDNKANVRKRGGQKKNKNAVGHKPSVPKRNKNAEKHGIFSKWLPEETKAILGDMINESPLDILWGNILLQTAAIIRAQNIMNVTDKDEIIKEVVKTKIKSNSRQTEKTSSRSEEEETEYAFQFAWDRQATFMNAQSRANATLQSMIRQYDDLLHKNWDLATEEQKARIEALKHQAKVNGGGDKDETGIVILPPVKEDTTEGVFEGGGVNG
jgi:uncharacterized protein YjcR